MVLPTRDRPMRRVAYYRGLQPHKTGIQRWWAPRPSRKLWHFCL